MSRVALDEPHDHTVQFYDLDHEVVGVAAAHCRRGLAAGDAAIVISGRSRMDGIQSELAGRGMDVDRARATGRLVWRDSSETLTKIMREGQPDRDLFHEVIGGLVAASACTSAGLRIFGDMVAILWSAGDPDGAIRLEELWNELAGRHAFALLCAYPLASVTSVEDMASLGRVCALHSRVIPPIDPNATLPEVPPDSHRRSRVYIQGSTSVRYVRHLVRDTLHAWGRLDLVDDSMIIASELASNVVNHASGPYRVVIERDAGTITVSVQDLSDQAPIRREPTARRAGGRGLQMIDELATAWGTHATSQGKVVWATLDHSTAD